MAEEGCRKKKVSFPSWDRHTPWILFASSTDAADVCRTRGLLFLPGYFSNRRPIKNSSEYTVSQIALQIV